MIWSDKYIKPANWDFKQQIENIKKREFDVINLVDN